MLIIEFLLGSPTTLAAISRTGGLGYRTGLIETYAAKGAEIDTALKEAVFPVQESSILAKTTATPGAPNPWQHQKHYRKESRKRYEYDPMRHEPCRGAKSRRSASKPGQESEEHQFAKP